MNPLIGRHAYIDKDYPHGFEPQKHLGTCVDAYANADKYYVVLLFPTGRMHVALYVDVIVGTPGTTPGVLELQGDRITK